MSVRHRPRVVEPCWCSQAFIRLHRHTNRRMPASMPLYDGAYELAPGLALVVGAEKVGR